MSFAPSKPSRVMLALASVLACAAPTVAQPSVELSRPGEIETEPIQCWWRTDHAAVRIGEHLRLTLTCGVIETSQVRVVAKLTELDPAAVALGPFEVIDGTRHDGFQTGARRYFQYQYVVRILGDEFFGQDVEIPSLEVTYNVQSAEGGGTEGRDQRYLLPTLPIRVLSLVPENADDIRDPATETFADIEARHFRASASRVAAWILFAFAAVLVGLTGVRGLGHYRVRAPAARTAPITTVLGGCLRELAQLKAGDGNHAWTPPKIGRALAAFRIAGAVAMERPLAQTVAAPHETAASGQLEIRTGILHRRRVLVSASTTATAIEQRLTHGNGLRSGRNSEAMLAEIRDALELFTAARYAHNEENDATALDQALATGRGVLRSLRRAKRRPGQALLSRFGSQGAPGGTW